MHEFSLLSVFLTVALLVLTFAVSRWLELDLEKDLGIGVVRSFFQLLAIGYVLEFLFRLDSIVGALIIFTAMMILGGQTCSRRSDLKSGVFLRAAAAIGVGGGLALGILFLGGVIPSVEGRSRFLPELRYFIPMASIIVGNAVSAASVAFDRFSSEMFNDRSLIEYALTEGASAWRAVKPTAGRSIKAGLIAAIDRMKLMGAVVLPGASVGMLIAGADPMQAVYFQMIVVYTLLFSRTVTTSLAVYLVYPLYFNRKGNLRTEVFTV